MTNDRLIQKKKGSLAKSTLKKKTGRSSINIMVLTVTQEMEEAEDVEGGGRGAG